LKLFEIPVSLADLYAVARTVRLSGSKHPAQSVRRFLWFIFIFRNNDSD